MSAAKLRTTVLDGRARQAELSANIQAARQAGDTDLLHEQTEQRRVSHIETVLARAELLTRAKSTSVSQYVGEEGKFDDLSVLERAKSFMLTEARETMTADERMGMITFAERFADAEARLENAEYEDT